MYWDSAATTKPKPEVIEAMMPYFTDKWYNPSAIYEPAREVRRVVESVRKKIADFINAEPEEVYFTSGGSESNSWVFNSFYKNCEWGQIDINKLEHHSIQEILNHNLPKAYFEIMDNDKMGKIDSFFLPNDDLISIQMANNEIGTIQDIEKLVFSARKENSKVLFHTDAVQAFGKIPIDVKKLDVDYLSASGHKIGTPKGIGFLYMRKGKELSPMIYGSQNHGYRGGTENVPYIVALGKAIDLVDYSIINRWHDIYNVISERVTNENIGTLNGDPEHRLWNIISLTIKDKINGDALIEMLAQQGEYVSNGSACNTFSNEPSLVLQSIGLTEDEINRTIRISLPEDVKVDDVGRLLNSIKMNVGFLKAMGE